MKKWFLVLLVSLMLFLSGCGMVQNINTGNGAASSETVYYSDTSAEDCYLCGGHIDNIIPSYWGQDNVALISLNTFEIKPIEINRYDKLDGHLIEEYAGSISFGGGESQNDGFSASMMLDCDRGYATGSLHFYEDEALDVEKARAFLCSDCLNRILPYDLNQCFGVGAINLATKEIRVFERRIIGFGLGDFHFDCHLMDKQKHSSDWMDLLIFYCPIRYENEY